MHERAARDVRSFAAYLEDQTEYTKARLRDVITRLNYDTLEPDGNKCFPYLEFWRGIDDFGSSVAINYDGGVDILQDEEFIVKPQYNHELHEEDSVTIAEAKAQNSVKIDVRKFPVSLLGYYQYRFSETALFCAWFAYLWQEIEGYQCGLKVRTVQNNSISMFSLNDFLDDDFSAFMESNYGGKPPRVENFFPRKLSVIELFLRAGQFGYPFNPYKNYWRYFEKGDEFTEIVTYECATGIRSGKLSERFAAAVTGVTQHDNSKSALMEVTRFTNERIFTGWQEKFRPAGMPERMHNNAYDFEYWTGVSWYAGEEQKSRLKAEEVVRFENTYRIKLPGAFFHYLRLFNGRQYNNHYLYFPINDLRTVKVKKFYTLEELDRIAASSLSEDPNVLWIGLLDPDASLGICVQDSSKDYGKIVIKGSSASQVCDYSFDKFARYAQSSPVEPEIFAARENDVAFLKERIEQGWDYNTTYMYQNAIGQAAEYNAHEVLELLLNAGARLNHKSHREITWLYDERTMDILDKYI
ncbi:hypothetical protein [Chryseosolibacter indicus]|uniref:Knr4/Smi1-like domain-containing protein n=1 Tax=Chryseosolibacter indicus TaxID=2782351 RepID=A0ABS5VZ21_9BACT|nr:hypothetical protein [Chryseosolibacter indicus]MBT1706313.1 hypothetical protein [Chryseosolibacter indicus]